MPKNNLDARIKQWELEQSKPGKSKAHKPGSQKK